MKPSQTFIIIGNGVAAWRVNAELERKFIDAKILRIASEDFAPACSYRSTAVNSLRGTQKGISPLGDLIVDSYEEFKRFYDKHSPDGVFKTHECQIWDPNSLESDAKWTRRYKSFERLDEFAGVKLIRTFKGAVNDAYLIEPLALKAWHNRRLQRTKIIEDYVTEVKQRGASYDVRTHKGSCFVADKIFLCSGHLSCAFKGLIKNEQALNYVNRSKPVRGSYLIGSAPKKLGPFSLAVESKHLISRNGKVMIGSSSENNSSVTLFRDSEMREIYRHVCAHLHDPKIVPKFEDMEFKVGVRHKGPKRTPWWGECSENVYGVFGLYKNGFSFSFKAAKDLISLID